MNFTNFCLVAILIVSIKCNPQLLFPKDDQESDTDILRQVFNPNEDFQEDFSGPSNMEKNEEVLDQGLPEGNDAESIRDRTALTPAALEEFEATVNDFTQDFLFKAWNQSGDNFVFSPFSLHMALSILTSGASPNSTTQNELLLALGRLRSIQAIELRYKGMIDDYNEHATDILNFGNKFYTNDRYFKKIRGRYIEKLTSLYDSDIEALNSKNPEKQINDWVNKATKGKIDNIVDSVSPEAAFLIVNALYFKASWTVVFEELPEPQAFTNANGDQVMTKMMTRTSFHNTVSVFESNLLPNQKFTAIAIPYEFQESRFEMVLVMPEDYRGLTFLHKQITEIRKDGQDNIIDDVLRSIETRRLQRNEVIITMPSFKVDSTVAVRDIFQKLGIVAAFTEGDFDEILKDEAIKVSGIKHRALVEVTKDGTVGAAASAIELVSLSATFDVPTEVFIDKPFLFFIRDVAQRIILFAGKYTNPMR